MKPKEKAKELISKFTFYFPTEINTIYYNPKQCALIAVDEILIAIQDLQVDEINWDYWQEVKQEIKNIS